MKTFLFVALLVAVLLALLWRGQQPRPAPRPMASVPIVRKHQPEPPKHVAPVLPHRYSGGPGL